MIPQLTLPPKARAKRLGQNERTACLVSVSRALGLMPREVVSFKMDHASARARAALAMTMRYKAGATLEDAAIATGMTRQSVHLLCKRWKERIEEGRYPAFTEALEKAFDLYEPELKKLEQKYG